MSTPAKMGDPFGGKSEYGQGVYINTTRGEKIRKKALAKKDLQIGDHVITDTGIKGFIKKITPDRELILEGCRFKINPACVEKI
ncbi:MAG: hypothetical protein ACOCVY_00390 [Patescibacteria group bacterium]|jgi:preprotein translocase subunit YajC